MTTVLKQAWYESPRVVTNALLAAKEAVIYADFRQLFSNALRREAGHEKKGKVVDLCLGGFDRASAGAFSETYRGNSLQGLLLETVPRGREQVCKHRYCVHLGGSSGVPGLRRRVPRAVVAARSSKREPPHWRRRSRARVMGLLSERDPSVGGPFLRAA